MSRKINATAKLQIALQPEGADDTAKQLTDLCDATSTLFNLTTETEEKRYFCNGGNATTVVVGNSYSLSVSIDYDNENPAHKYLYDLLQKGMADSSKYNNQYVKLFLPLEGTQTQAATHEGKACFVFKNNVPSGGANELIKIDFDIMPQDKNWKFTEGQ